MTAKEFKELWKHIEGKPVNIGYGKQIFRNIILTEYKEALATVKTSMKGLLNVRSIKTITPLEISKPEAVIEVPVEEVVVTPRLPEGWDSNGYFIIVGRYGGNWKHVELKNSRGETMLQTDSSYSHELLKEKIRGLKRTLKQSPNYLIDDSFAAPVYYEIKKGVAMDWFFNQLN